MKYRTGQDAGIAAHIKVYRNRGQRPRYDTPFLMPDLEGVLLFF